MKFRQPRRRARTGESELAFGGIDPVNGQGRAALDDILGEGAIAAADIDPFQARCRLEPVDEHVAGHAAPDAHESFIGRTIVEADLRFSHFSPVLLR